MNFLDIIDAFVAAADPLKPPPSVDIPPAKQKSAKPEVDPRFQKIFGVSPLETSGARAVQSQN